MILKIKVLALIYSSIFQSQHLIVALLLVFIFILFALLVLLIRKDKKRQGELIQLDRKLKEEQLTSQLKEKELKSINALVKVQEKERFKITDGLYDELQTYVTELRSHFDGLKFEGSNELFQKIHNSIEEAYQKILYLAQAKDHEMLGEHGFLKAIKLMAEDMTSSFNLRVRVYENDFNQDLENFIELSVFRIIQELVNNVIQHARATEVDIHLNMHDNILNLMVEDNGKGFNTSQITQNKSGIGLKSLDRRIENLEGKMIIESRMGVGTSVIIDLPLSNVE